MPGDQERHALIADLLVGEPAAVALRVHGEEEHGEEIALVAPGGAPLADEAPHGLVEDAHGPALPSLGREGEPVRRRPG